MTDVHLPLTTRAGHRRIGPRSTGFPGRLRLMAAIAAMLLAATLINWIVTIPGGAARTDFAPVYASALLVREGHAEAMYDSAAQTAVLRSATGDPAPTTSPTALMPPAILVAVPLTLLPLRAASLLWSLVQALLLAAAAMIAIRAAPWPASTTRSVRILVAIAAVCGGGSLMLLPLNQWDAVAAVGLALTYADLRRGHDNRGMVWLALTALAGKPHLAIGVAVFLIARRPLSVIPGALAGAGLAALSLLVIPLSTVGQLLSAIVHVSNAFPPATTIGIGGMVDSFLGTSAGATIAGYVLSGTCLAFCVALGRANGRRRGTERPGRVDPVFLSVSLLSLLMAPHVYPYDLVLLIPGFAGCVAWASARDRVAAWPGKQALLVLGAWFVVTIVCVEMLLPPGSYRPTPILPLVLLACAAGSGVLARVRESMPRVCPR